MNWQDITPKEVQKVSVRMFDAAEVPKVARIEYYQEFDKYIYNLK